MITGLFVAYAIILAALAWYLAAHRRQFLGRATTAAQAHQLMGFAWAFGLAAIVSVAAAIIAIQWLQISALLLGAVIAGWLGTRLPHFLA